MITKKAILAAMLAAPAALAIAAPANAQVAGIAYANPTSVVAASKAFGTANQQISTTYKAAFDQMQQRRTALENELKPLVAQLDTNKDGKVSEEEGKAAQTAKNPAVEKIRTAQTNAQNDLESGRPLTPGEMKSGSIFSGYCRGPYVFAPRVMHASTPNVRTYARTWRSPPAFEALYGLDGRSGSSSFERPPPSRSP